jgi:hypothetical protein
MVGKHLVIYVFVAFFALQLSYNAFSQVSGNGALFGVWSGRLSEPSGNISSSETYRFQPDGSFTGTTDTLIGGKVYQRRTAGKIHIQGKKISIEEESAQGGRGPLKTTTYTWQIEKEGPNMWLILTDADGFSQRYKKLKE